MSNLYDALASAIYVSRQTLAGAAIDTDDKRIRASGLYEDWVKGSYQVGDIRNANGQTWECFQAHDNATHPDIRPDNPPGSPSGGPSMGQALRRPDHLCR